MKMTMKRKCYAKIRKKRHEERIRNKEKKRKQDAAYLQASTGGAPKATNSCHQSI